MSDDILSVLLFGTAEVVMMYRIPHLTHLVQKVPLLCTNQHSVMIFVIFATDVLIYLVER